MTLNTQRPLRSLLCLIGLTFFAYTFVLSGSFKVLDDETSIVRNQDIKSFASLPKLFTQSFFGGDAYYRPLVSLSYAVEYHFFGLQPFYYYLTNIFLHAGSVVVLWIFFRLLLKKEETAFAAALLFALHPIDRKSVV